MRIRHIVFVLAFVVSGGAVPGAEPTVEQVLAATDGGRGLVVIVGTTDGGLEARVAAAGKGDLLVSGVAVGAEAAAKARAGIDRDGQTGYASVSAQPSLAALPYNGNIANVVVADLERPGAPSLDEVLRVVHPFGSALVHRKGEWTVIVKPLPKEMDEWTHYDHGPEGNPQSRDSLVADAKGLQWWVSSYGNTVTTTRLAGGRRFQGVTRSGAYAGVNRTYQARDAFNGLPLWRLDPPNDLFDYYRHQDRLVAANNDVVVGLFNAPGFAEVRDARTGQRKLELIEGLRVEGNFKQVRHSTPLLELHHVLIGTSVIQAMKNEVVCLDVATGKRAWAYTTPAGSYVAHLAVDNDACVVGTSPDAQRFNVTYGNYMCRLGSVVGLDRGTGNARWTSEAAAGFFTFGILLDQGVIHIADSESQDQVGYNLPQRPLAIRN